MVVNKNVLGIFICIEWMSWNESYGYIAMWVILVLNKQNGLGQLALRLRLLTQINKVGTFSASNESMI